MKNIIFDMGGVLLDLNMQAVYDAFTEMGCGEVGRLIDPYLQSGIFLDLEKGKVTPGELCDEIRRVSRPDVTDKQIYEALYHVIDGMPSYKLDMLLELRAKGHKVYMLSNTNAIIMPYVTEGIFRSQGLTINDYFDKLFLSYEMGVVKPHKLIFEKIIAEGIEPSETLFIDDAEANTKVGAEMGFHVYLATANEDFRHIFK